MTGMDDRAQVSGLATAEGTDRFRRRFPRAGTGHFREAAGLTLSSIGIGTYLGRPDAADDQAYRAAIRASVAMGCNVIDSAINYRCQRSERAVGQVLRDLAASGTVTRDEIVVCTKGGYLPFDDPSANPKAWVERTFIEPGVCGWPDIVASNVMTPAYIRHQLQASLDNLHLTTIDVYYLHNPESQLQGMSRAQVMSRLTACFAELEVAASAGLIGCYGVATWDAFRVGPDHPAHLSLADLVAAARTVGGPAHHLRFVQLPLSLGMPEALVADTQPVDGSMRPALDAARGLGLVAVASGSLLQGRLTVLPAEFATIAPGTQTDAQRALQFVRSAPGVTTALVGMKTAAHVHDNLALTTLPPLTGEQFAATFGGA